MQNSINVKEGDKVWNTEMNQRFMKNQIGVKLRATISKRGIMPSISLSTTQLAPLICKKISTIKYIFS